MSGLRGYAEHFSTPEGYLDFARFGPPSRDVLDANSRALAASAEAGHATVDELLAEEAATRGAAARLIGVPAGQVVLLPNTSTGLFHAALGIPSGTVLVPEGEFPANTYPWRRAAALGRAAPRWLPGPATPDSVKSALTDDVTAVSLSAVDFRTGYRADLAALREVIGPDRLLVVDAIQAVGAFEMPWQAADVVVSGGQKWLRAGWSTGFMAVSERAVERLEPVLTGWTGVQDPEVFDGLEHPPAPEAARFSVTRLSPVAAAGLRAALELVERVGVRAVERHICERVDQIIDTVRAAGGLVVSPAAHRERAGIVTFTVPGTAPGRVADALRAHGVTPALRADSVRLSAHASTPLAAVDRVLAALSEVRG